MGNAASEPRCTRRDQLALACSSIDTPVSRAAARLLLRNAPHAVFAGLPKGTTACFVDDDCIGVLAALVEEYCPEARVPYSAAEQWVEANSQEVQRGRSARTF